MAAIPRLSGSQGLQNRLTSRETDGDRRVMAVLLRLELSRSEIAALTVGDLHQNRDDDSLRVHAQTRAPRCPRDEAADRCTDTRVSRLRLARGRFCHGRAKRSLARYDRSLPSVASRSSNRRLSRVLGSSGFYDAAPISLLCQDVHVEGAEHLVLAPPGKIWMFSHLAASERGRQTVGVECSDTEPQLVFG